MQFYGFSVSLLPLERHDCLFAVQAMAVAQWLVSRRRDAEVGGACVEFRPRCRDVDGEGTPFDCAYFAKAAQGCCAQVELQTAHKW